MKKEITLTLGQHLEAILSDPHCPVTLFNAITESLAELENEEAKQRQRATQLVGKGKQRGKKNGGDKLPPPSGNKKTREKVGFALGMSGSSYEHAKSVVMAATEQPQDFGHLVEKMDQKGIHSAYLELKSKTGPDMHEQHAYIDRVLELRRELGSKKGGAA